MVNIRSRKLSRESEPKETKKVTLNISKKSRTSQITSIKTTIVEEDFSRIGTIAVFSDENHRRPTKELLFIHSNGTLDRILKDSFCHYNYCDYGPD
jgi:hypothetical protein